MDKDDVIQALNKGVDMGIFVKVTDLETGEDRYGTTIPKIVGLMDFILANIDTLPNWKKKEAELRKIRKLYQESFGL